MGGMEFSEVLRRRHMVRNYDADRPVPPDVRDRLLDAAMRAPSAGFTQGWRFLVLETAGDRERFWAAAGGQVDGAWLTGMRRAPLLVVVFSDKRAYLDRYAEKDKGWTDRDEARWPVPYWHVDAGFAALLMTLAAVDERLGACFFGVPGDRVEVVKDAFGVPGDLEPVGVVSVGYPAAGGAIGSAGRRPRLSREQVVHRGRW